MLGPDPDILGCPRAPGSSSTHPGAQLGCGVLGLLAVLVGPAAGPPWSGPARPWPARAAGRQLRAVRRARSRRRATADQRWLSACSARVPHGRGLLRPAELLGVPSAVLGEAGELTAQLRAPVLRPAGRGHGAVQRFRLGGQSVMGARGLVGAHVRRPRGAELAGALGLPGGAGRRCGRPGPAPRRRPGGAANRSAARGAARTSAFDAGRCGRPARRAAASCGAAAPASSASSASICRDPLLAVRGPGGRPDVPGPAGDVPAAQRAVAPAAVRGHRRGCAPGRRGRCCPAPRAIVSAGSSAAGSGRSAAESGRPGRGPAGLSSSSPSAASRVPSGWMTALSSPAASSAPSSPARPVVAQLVGEVDAAPQRLAGALRGQPGRLGRLRVPFGGQVLPLGPQRRFPFASTVASARSRRARSASTAARAGRTASSAASSRPTERAVVLAGQRLGVEDQRADGRVGRPVDLAEQVAGLLVIGPGAPGLGQGDGRGVPLGEPFLRRRGRPRRRRARRCSASASCRRTCCCASASLRASASRRWARRESLGRAPGGGRGHLLRRGRRRPG